MEQIAQRMSSIKHKVLVLSGKGGVGKSTCAAQLAFALAAAGKEVRRLTPMARKRDCCARVLAAACLQLLTSGGA